jgi:hypothetical protein
MAESHWESHRTRDLPPGKSEAPQGYPMHVGPEISEPRSLDQDPSRKPPSKRKAIVLSADGTP